MYALRRATVIAFASEHTLHTLCARGARRVSSRALSVPSLAAIKCVHAAVTSSDGGRAREEAKTEDNECKNEHESVKSRNWKQGGVTKLYVNG